MIFRIVNALVIFSWATRDESAAMCTCPADDFNGTSMAAETLPLWLPPVRTEALGSSTPVDRWLINQSQFECWWTIGHSSCVFWLPGAERPGKVEKPDSGAIAARPLVAAMLTVIFAYLVIRNLIGWHRNLPAGGGQSAALVGGPLRPRRRWRDDGDWIDYFADDSDSFDPVAVEEDHDRLFVGALDSGRLLGLPAEPALCAVTYQEELEEDVSMQLYDVTSLSSDGCWSSSGTAESLAVTGRESPLHPTLLICSPLTACYVCRPDGNNNNNSSSSASDPDEFEFRSISSARSFATASSSMSISFSDAVSDCSWEFDTASSG